MRFVNDLNAPIEGGEGGVMGPGDRSIEALLVTRAEPSRKEDEGRGELEEDTSGRNIPLDFRQKNVGKDALIDFSFAPTRPTETARLHAPSWSIHCCFLRW